MNGRPSIFLHGFTGSPRSWARAVASLGDRATCLPLPGHAGGLSIQASDRFEDIVDRFAESIPEETHLIGYSLGARIALALAVKRPKSFFRLTLIGVHPGLESDEERVARRIADEQRASLLKSEGLDGFVRRWEGQPLFASQASLPKALLEEQRAIRLSHDPEQLALVLTQLGLGSMPSYWPALSSIEAEVELVVGQRDEKFRDLAERARATADWKVRVVADAGHNVALERPDAIESLLNTVETKLDGA